MKPWSNGEVDDLVSTIEAKQLSHHKSAYGFIRWARAIGLTEIRRAGGRLFWRKSEIEAAFHEKNAPREATGTN